MRRIFRQGGFLLIVGAILIIIGALLATVVTFLFVARSESGIEHLGGAQALFLAEAGREQALRGLVTDNTYCSSVSYPNVSFGAGNFSASATLNISARVALGSAVAATASVIPVSSTANFAAHGRIRIEDEEINYAALSTSCAPFANPACFTGAWRGVAGTTAAAHAINTSVSQEQCLITSVGSVPNIGSQRTIETARRFIPAMIAYSKGTNTPYYRLWEGTAWGPERTALAVTAGADIRFIRIAHARNRNEVTLVTQDHLGRISAQFWNGASWGNQQLNFITSSSANTRGFDVAYETARDRALIVYNASAGSNASGSTWDGANFQPAVTVTLATIGDPRWIRLASNPSPTSNEIMLIALGTTSARVYGARWTGSAWDYMLVAANWDTANNSAYEGIGVAYEQQSSPGDALFIWGSNSALNRQRYRTWNGSALSGTSNLNTGGAAGLNNSYPHWIRLAPDPRSNRILYATQSSTQRLVTRSWTGSAFDTVTEHPAAHSTNVEDNDTRAFDIVFETHPGNAGRAWLVFGDAPVGADFVKARSGSAVAGNWSWNAINTLTDSTEDTSYVGLFAHPRTGSVFAGLYEDPGSATNYIRSSNLTQGGSTWASVTQNIIWTGPTSAVDPQYERVDISAGRFLPRIDWPEVFR